MQFWQEFLRTHSDKSAHFHSEIDDLVLEMKPTPTSQKWLWVYRPATILDTDETRDEMCQEMLRVWAEESQNEP